MMTEAITGPAPGSEVRTTTTDRGRTGEPSAVAFVDVLGHAAQLLTEPAPTPPATTPAPAAPAPPAPTRAPSPSALTPPLTTGPVGGISPGTIGALLAAASGSGADLVAGTIAQLIGSSPATSMRFPPTGAGATDIALSGDMEQRRRTLEPLFEAAGARYGVDPALLQAVAWTESAFQPDVVSHAGAIGLMQIMPGTAEGLGVDPRDPVQAIDGGARYLRDALNQFGGDVRLALAAYNAGPGAVASHGGIPPYPETIAYVTSVMDRYESLRGAST